MYGPTTPRSRTELRGVASGGITIGGDMGDVTGRSLKAAGVGLLLFPVWGPVADGEGFRWPRGDDLPAYALAIAIGLGFLVWGLRKG